MTIDDIEFGKIDAYDEYTDYKSTYTEGFYEFENYRIDKFKNGDRYYLCGGKGTGKTAFLKYLESTVSDSKVIFLRFNKDFSGSDRQDMKRLATNKDYNAAPSSLDDVDGLADCVVPLQVYLISLIFNYEDANSCHIFKNDNNLKHVKEIFRKLIPNDNYKILPKLKRGKLSISANILNSIFIGFSGNLETGTEEIDYQKLTKYAMDEFKKIKTTNTSCFLLIDELELSVNSPKETARDAKLVCDLILAVYELNRLFKEKDFNIKVIAAIREDVLLRAQAIGNELNKKIESYGVHISWYRGGGSDNNNPIIKLIEKKIRASEKRNKCEATGNVWETYFEPKTMGIDTKRFLLGYSWQRPRDVVRFLSIVRDKSNGNSKFTQEMFERSMKEYSKQAWTEISEELCIKFARDEISLIQKILTGITIPFTQETLKQRIEQLSKDDSKMKDFSKKHKLSFLLDNLFDVGVIGNTGRRMIFKFLDDNTLNYTGDMIIHQPLRNFFAIPIKKHITKNSQNDSHSEPSESGNTLGEIFYNAMLIEKSNKERHKRAGKKWHKRPNP